MARILGRVLCLGVAAAVLASLGAAPARAETTLRYKFKQGDTYNYVVEQKMKMEMSIGGNDLSIGVTQLIDMTTKVTSVGSDGKAKLTQTIDRVRLTMDGGPQLGGKTEFDSKQEKDPEGPIGGTIAPMLRAMVGPEFTLTMSPTGEVSDVKIPQKVLDAFKNAPGGAGGLGNVFSPDSFKEMMSDIAMVLPKEPVKKGDTWNQKSETKMPNVGKMIIDTKATYEGEVTRGGKKLEQIGLKRNLAIETTPGSPLQVKLKNQDTKGTAYFDNEKGQMAEVDTVQKFEMEFGAGGQTFTMKIDQTVNVKQAPPK